MLPVAKMFKLISLGSGRTHLNGVSERVEGGGEATSRACVERVNADAEQMVNQVENNGTGRDGVVSRGRLRMNGTDGVLDRDVNASQLIAFGHKLLQDAHIQANTRPRN